ncbi:MAG: hypothetical protein VX742_10735 [Actinomycetota bacterium]|nr:hypothetical protein [Actinomycetota bacterium]MEC8068092.1 hypothetical protein [Actinomycetota bacterium]
MKLVEWLSRLGLSDRIVIVVAAVVYATMVLLMLWFWSEPPAPFRYTEI